MIEVLEEELVVLDIEIPINSEAPGSAVPYPERLVIIYNKEESHILQEIRKLNILIPFLYTIKETP